MRLPTVRRVAGQAVAGLIAAIAKSVRFIKVA
jgi:hypothetical protein